MKVEQKGHTVSIKDTQGDLVSFLMKVTHEHKSFEKYKNQDDLLHRSALLSKMYGNYLQDESIEVANQRLMVFVSPQEMVKIFKQYRLVSKNYCMTLMTKIKVVMKILSNLLKEMPKKLRENQDLLNLEIKKLKKSLEGIQLDEDQALLISNFTFFKCTWNI